MRFTPFSSTVVVSGITVWNAPFASSFIDEDASFLRSSDFGVMTISGFLNGRSIWRRSRWKTCAAVVGTHTCMLCSAQSCR